MLSTASPPRLVDNSPGGAGSPALSNHQQPVSQLNGASAAQMLAPLSAAAYLEMASRALGNNINFNQNSQNNNAPNSQGQAGPGDMASHQYASALAAAAFQERQQQIFSAMCGAVLNHPGASAQNPLAAMLSNPAAAAALMAPHLMAACFREEPKPPHSYIGLIAMAILSSPEKKMVLSDIYQWILDHYPYFRTRGPGWRNSIRHNLSLNDCFVKVGRSANGKGHFWAIHPANLNDFQRGDFRRKKAQKRIKKHMGIIDNDDDDDDECMLGDRDGQLALSDEDDAPNKTSPATSAKSSLSMSPAERFSEFLLMKNGGGGAAIHPHPHLVDDLNALNDPVAMAARLAMRLSGANGLHPNFNILPGVPGNNPGNGSANNNNNINNTNNINNASSSSSSSSPVEVVIDEDSADMGGRAHHLNINLNLNTLNHQLLSQHLNRLVAANNSPGDHSASKKRRIFDIDSLLAPTS